MVDNVTTRADRAAALERWADEVVEDELREVDMSALREIAELAERRLVIDAELTEAVRRARRAQRTWSEIGAMLGVSKQAAQRKYGPGPTAA
jgi:chromosome segregation ATPase